MKTTSIQIVVRTEVRRWRLWRIIGLPVELSESTAFALIRPLVVLTVLCGLIEIIIHDRERAGWLVLYHVATAQAVARLTTNAGDVR